MYDCMHENIKQHLGYELKLLTSPLWNVAFIVPVFLSRKETGRASCVCGAIQKRKSTLQDVVTLSTSEAECMTTTEGGQEVVYIIVRLSFRISVSLKRVPRLPTSM